MSSQYVRYAVLTAPGKIEIHRRPASKLERGQVRIAVEQCGVSDAELQLWGGRREQELPSALGYEFAGRVTEVARDVEGVKVGDRVAPWVPTACGMADEAVVKAVHCFKLGGGVAFPFAAEPLARVVNAVHKAAVPFGADTLVLGAGLTGALAVQLAQGTPRVIVARSQAEATMLATSLPQIDIATPRDVARVVDQVTQGQGSDVVYEFSGAQAGLEQASRVVRPGGKLVIGGFHKGFAADGSQAVLGSGQRVLDLGRLNWMAVDLVNAHTRDARMIEWGQQRARQLLEQGVVEDAALRPWIRTSDELARLLASVLIAVERADMRWDHDTVVIGNDARALVALRVIREELDPRTLILATPEPRLHRVARSLGATHVVDPVDLDVAVADVTYEFTGAQEGLDLATRAVRLGGKLVIGGVHSGLATPDGRWTLQPGQRVLDLEGLNTKAVQLVNGHVREPKVILQGMRRAAWMLNNGGVSTAGLVGRTFRLEEAGAAFEVAAHGLSTVVVKP